MTIAHTGQEVKMLNQGVRVWRRKEGEQGEETRIDNKDEHKAKTSQVSALLTTLVLFRSENDVSMYDSSW